MATSTSMLITGGSGLLGSALRKIIPNATYVSSKEYDLTLMSEVQRMYKKIKPSRVIHLAARVGGIFDNIHHPSDYFEENILMNTFMVKYARESGVKRFLGILSSCIYPDVVESYPLKEEDIHKGPPTSSNFSYGMAKRALAVQIESCNEQYGTNYNYLIPCNLYGTSDKDDDEKSHFVTALVKKIHLANRDGKESIVLYGDGSPLRQFMHADDAARVLQRVIEQDITESFNLAPEENISIDAIARVALRSTNSERLSIVYDTSKPNGQMRKDVCTDRFKRLIPNFSFLGVGEGIARCYMDYEGQSCE